MKPTRGLTLVEVLVALLVIAIALVSASHAISAWLRASQRQGEALRAQLCADNAMQELRLSRQMPGLGSRTSECTQAGQTLQLRTEVHPTPNPVFFRVDVHVWKIGRAHV